MLFVWLVSYMILWTSVSEALCPSTCTCKQTEKGKRKVSCTRGGMTDPIPTTEMDPGMEVIEISAPERGPWNALSIGSIFQSFKYLEEVIIRRSNVKMVGMHAFWGVPSLQVLDLSHNNVSGVHDHNFRGLVNLIELNLKDNKIKFLEFGVFKHLTELRVLILEKNLLEELMPKVFYKLNKLHVLKLSGNKFKDFSPEAFKDIPELRMLECRRCNLKRINTQIYHLLPYLSHLDFGDNLMPYMADDDFLDLQRLHSLKLDGNFFPVILEKTFRMQFQLKYLCLARNRIVKITDTAFFNMTNLIELDISYNKMRTIESEYLTHIADNLQRLVISGNKVNLNDLRIALNTLNQLWSLDMSNMKIDNISEHFFPDRIKRLNLSHNSLTEIKIEALPRSLTDLDLSSNNLLGLEERMVLKLENLKSVHLFNNSWSCDLCHISAILLRINKTDLYKNLSCASPNYLKNLRFRTLKIDDISNCETSSGDDDFATSNKSKLTIVVGLTSVIVFLLLCVSFVVFSCRRRRKHTLHEQKRAERETGADQDPQAVFSKDEISFKFPLDLKVSISTIDEIKRDTRLQTLPNGTGI